MAATAKRLERVRMTSVAILDGSCGEGGERSGGAGGSATGRRAEARSLDTVYRGRLQNDRLNWRWMNVRHFAGSVWI